MINYLRLVPFFLLLIPVTSFVPAAAVLGFQALQFADLRTTDFYVAVLFSCFAAASSLLLCVFLAIDIFTKRAVGSTRQRKIKLEILIAVACLVVGAYAFFVEALSAPDNFFVSIDGTAESFSATLFKRSALETWMISIAAFSMAAIEKFGKFLPQKAEAL